MDDESTTALDYVDDMILATEKIERFVEGLNRDEFVDDEKTADAVLRNLEVIGEASKLLPEEFREDHPDVPWSAMAGMRDKLIHGYATVDLDIVWTTITEALPELGDQLTALKADIDGE